MLLLVCIVELEACTLQLANPLIGVEELAVQRCQDWVEESVQDPVLMTMTHDPLHQRMIWRELRDRGTKDILQVVSARIVVDPEDVELFHQQHHQHTFGLI